MALRISRPNRAKRRAHKQEVFSRPDAFETSSQVYNYGLELWRLNRSENKWIRDWINGVTKGNK